MNRLIVLVLLATIASSIKTNNNDTYRSIKTKVVFIEDKFSGHPCSSDSTCDCWYEEATSRLSIDCSRRNFTEPPMMHQSLHIAELDLSMNMIRQAPDMRQEGYKLVRGLKLSGNRIEKVTSDLISPNLKALYLDNNSISRIDESVLKKIFGQSNVTVLTLHGNPWTCDCESAPLVDFLHMASLYPNISNVTCGGTDIKLIDLTPEKLCSDENTPSSPMYADETNMKRTGRIYEIQGVLVKSDDV